MNIAIISQPVDRVLRSNPTSIGIITLEIANRLAVRHKVTVYIGSNKVRKKIEKRGNIEFCYIPTTPDKYFLKIFNKLSKVILGYRIPIFNSVFYYINYVIQIARDLKTRKCDIVHLHNFSQFAPVIRAFSPTSKIVLHMHCEWLTQLEEKVVHRRLDCVNIIIGVSDYITEKIKYRFPLMEPYCHTVFNGVDLSRFRCKNHPGPTVTDNLKRILFVGRVSPEKGVHILIQAIHRVVNKKADVLLDIIGSNAQLPREYIVGFKSNERVASLDVFYKKNTTSHYRYILEKEIARLNISDKVNFVGHVPHSGISDWYRNSDLVVNPSFSESFGMSLIEAMASGVPVIASRTGGMQEIIEDGKTGTLVEPGNVTQLADAILELLQNAEVRGSMGLESMKRAQTIFSWDKSVETLTSCYRSVC